MTMQYDTQYIRIRRNTNHARSCTSFGFVDLEKKSDSTAHRQENDRLIKISISLFRRITNFLKTFQYQYKDEQRILFKNNLRNLSLLKCISGIKDKHNDVTRQHKKKNSMRWMMEEKGMKKRKFIYIFKCKRMSNKIFQFNI